MPGSNVSFKDYNVQIGYQSDMKSPYRHLWIVPISSDGVPVNGIFVLFTDDRGAEPGIGYYNPGNGWVVGLGLNRDFDSVYQLLRAGKDLLFRWYADEQNKMVWFQIAGDHGGGSKFVAQAEGLLRDLKVTTLSERPRK